MSALLTVKQAAHKYNRPIRTLYKWILEHPEIIAVHRTRDMLIDEEALASFLETHTEYHSYGRNPYLRRRSDPGNKAAQVAQIILRHLDRLPRDEAMAALARAFEATKRRT